MEKNDSQKQQLFEKIYQEYYKLLYYVSKDILKNPEDASDAVQETFLRAAANFDKIAANTPILCPKTKNYLVIICKRISLDQSRKKRRKEQKLPMVPLDHTQDMEDVIDTYALDPLMKTCDKETVCEIIKDILSMNEKYSECLYMELILEMDYKEIAELFSQKPETIRKRLQRGKKKLRSLLEKKGFQADII